MLAHQNFGRRHQRALRARFHRAQQASSATTVLPEPTSPCSSRSMRLSRPCRLRFRPSACSCASVRAKGRAAMRFGLQHARRRRCARPLRAAHAARGSAAAPAGWPAARHRPAAGAPAWSGARSLSCTGACAVAQRCVEAAQPRCLQERRVLPFRHRRHFAPARRAPPWPSAAASGLRSGHRPVHAAADRAASSGATT